ncbi:MAG: 2-dehydro-3-deoxygalactonokinase [Pseudomonadota bacterium]
MDGVGTHPTWVAIDWGTSHLRAWAMSEDGQELAFASSDQGIGRISPADCEAALLDVIAPWIAAGATEVVACGMIGSRHGWVEAPYAKTPCAPPTETIIAPTERDGLNVHVIGGVQQDDPADVMRGEETQIAGFLALNPDWDGVLCLPGTHTKWVQISAGELISFQTFMTGEMFDLLSQASTLRHAIRADAGHWDDDVFTQALADALARPEATAARLFHIRAASVSQTDSLPDGWTTARLSGLLIGAELAAARPYWLGMPVAVIGARQVADPYTTGLVAQGVPVVQTDATQMTLAGLKAVYRSWAQASAQ